MLENSGQLEIDQVVYLFVLILRKIRLFRAKNHFGVLLFLLPKST